MSGRGRSGRGGRGPKNQGGRGPTKEKTSTKKTVNDYVYYVGSSKQASDYELTTQFLINHIQMTFDDGCDIATALKELKPFDHTPMRPKLGVSNASDTSVKERETEELKMVFKSELDEYTKRVSTYKKNVTKAYSFLWDRCSKAMRNKVEARTDFQKIENDPIRLLKAIKEHALNYQENRYEFGIISDAMRTFLGTKQKEGENLQDYTKRFRVAMEVLESHIGGPIIFTKYVKTKVEGYVSASYADQAKAHKTAFEAFCAYTYLENSDPAKYGSIMSGLSTQLSLGNSQYPKTITEANNVLSNHRFDSTTTSHQSNKKKANDQKANERGDSKRDKEDETPALSFAQMEGKCYCCGKGGHKSPQCRHKDRPKDQWAINKAKEQSEQQAHVQTQQSVSTTEQKTSGTTSTEGWAGTHIQFYQATEMRNVILLDNQSSTTIFCNPKLVTNIHTTSETMMLMTNGGVLTTNQKATIPNWGEAWFSSKAVTNIFSFSEMAQRYRITYDTREEDAFIVHLETKKVKFVKDQNGLYIYRPKILIDDNEVRLHHQFVTTLDENKTFYTSRQFDRAKRARDLYHSLRTPTVSDFKAIIRINAIKDNPVTTEDIELAEKIFGPDIGTLKGKTTRRKPLPVVSDYIEIPQELVNAQRDITLCIDGMYVNGLTFLSTISRNLYYRTAQYIENRTADEHKEALRSVLRVYNNGGFHVRYVHCNNEFRSIMDKISEELGVRPNYANPQEHVPEAERNNRVIKERVRATYHRLPYTHLPKIMVKYLVSEAAKKLNFFPAKHGISRYYSPRMILHQENLNYNKHCVYSFGTYVQAHDEPGQLNTNRPRTLDCIYLRYNANQQGGHELLHLQTNRVIIRRNVTPIPITPTIIRQVHRLAELEGMPQGLALSVKQV